MCLGRNKEEKRNIAADLNGEHVDLNAHEIGIKCSVRFVCGRSFASVNIPMYREIWMKSAFMKNSTWKLFTVNNTAKVIWVSLNTKFHNRSRTHEKKKKKINRKKIANTYMQNCTFTLSTSWNCVTETASRNANRKSTTSLRKFRAFFFSCILNSEKKSDKNNTQKWEICWKRK